MVQMSRGSSAGAVSFAACWLDGQAASSGVIKKTATQSRKEAISLPVSHLLTHRLLRRQFQLC
jgi:hypothetical protein